MPTPATLTFVRSNETTITMAGASATAIELLTAIKALVDASTYWNGTLTTDAGNARAYLEFAPKSGATMRGLLAYSTGTVAGVVGTERPLKAFRQTPYATADATLAQRMWVGVSPDAGATANDPYAGGGTQPYTNWTKFLPVSSIQPPAGSTMWILESAEGIAVLWTVAANAVNGFEVGNYFEAADRQSTKASVVSLMAAGDTTAPATSHAWKVGNDVVAADYGLPALCNNQHSAGTALRVAMLVMGTDHILYGAGRNQFDTLGTYAMDYNGATAGMWENISLAGGQYVAGSSTQPLGYYRQHFWGPQLVRAQGASVAGVNTGYVMGYDSATPRKGVVWCNQAR